MTYKGHVENGAIVLDDPAELPEGAAVNIELVPSPASVDDELGPSFTERFAEIMGKAQSLPEDAAQNHDYYLYGAAKK
ncbi:MAG: hypothetical protein HY706_03455 [Candidatus Hydrogenedentes bacterium]|nr:hypothetical protein [Candidatus Hydrogenedentota bacterium]